MKGEKKNPYPDIHQKLWVLALIVPNKFHENRFIILSNPVNESNQHVAILLWGKLKMLQIKEIEEKEGIK